ncbi:ATP-binding cassette domain-containing protein [Halobacillus fulvus]|nr:ATP-binding cassette domain-containing protein [Halobacillus fulvus]
MKPVVKLENVSKQFSFSRKKSDQLLEMLSVKKKQKNFTALSNISFEVFRGETIGIIGTNGSGKSTLSNLLAQIVPPTSGSITIDGEPTLVAISAGLNNHLTGLENIELKCLMHGLNKKEIKSITPDIMEFADIGDFISQPIKNYSSGMKARLGFAISVHIDPDILVIDEALSVGDSTFHQKCVDKFHEFKQEGKTIFFISHSLSQVKSISDRILWMNHGHMEMFDEKEKVATEYSQFIKWFNALSSQEKKVYRKSKIQNQLNEQLPETTTLRRSRKVSKRNTRLSFPLLFVSLITLLSSILLLFGDNFDSFTAGATEASNKETTVDSAADWQEVGQPGFTIQSPASLYSDEELTDVETEIPFASEMLVQSVMDGVYKVEHDGQILYTEKAAIQLDSGSSSQVADISLGDLARTFPERFVNSYEYFFAFMGADYETVTSNLNGYTDQGINELDQKFLEFSDDHVTIIFDEKDDAGTFVVSELNTSHPVINQLIEEARMYSVDKTLYNIQTEQYSININMRASTLMVTKIGED